MPTLTKNLGLVKAIFVAVSPPTNINVLWYDDNVGQKIHKYYDVVTAMWLPLISPPSAPIWGSITGTLSNQTDLQAILDSKSNDTDVVHINGTETVIGSKSFSANISANGGIDSIGALNIGTATTTGINIGYPGMPGPVNIYGPIIEEFATSNYVDAKFITLNKNGSLLSGLGVGFKIEENSAVAGYLTTNNTREGYVFKAPAISGAANLSLSLLTNDHTYSLQDGDGTLAFLSDLNGYVATSDIIDFTHGGTGQSSYIQGDTLYASATNILSKLPIGTSGQIYTVVAGIPQWQDPSGTAISGTIDYLSKFNATGDNIINSQILDNGTNIGINIALPTAKVHIVSNGATASTFSIKIDNASSVNMLYLNDKGEFNIKDSIYLDNNKTIHYGQASTQETICIGKRAGESISTGAYNTIGGVLAGPSLNTGSANTLYGYSAAGTLTAGNLNVGFGFMALHGITTQNANVAVGFQAGYTAAGNTNLYLGHLTGLSSFITGARNIFLGTEASQAVAGVFNDSAAIGATSKITKSNQLVLGGGGQGIFTEILLGQSDAQENVKQTNEILITTGSNYRADTTNVNLNGPTMIYAAGQSFGAGDPGDLRFETGSIGASGAVLNTTRINRMTIKGTTGFVGIGTTNPTAISHTHTQFTNSSNVLKVTNPSFTLLNITANGIIETYGTHVVIGSGMNNGASAAANGVVRIGYAAGSFNTTNYITGIGHYSLSNNQGNSNTAVGAFTLSSALTGDDNSAFGYAALTSLSTGFGNTGLGSQSMYSTTAGAYNVAVGFGAMRSTTTGYQNVAIGGNRALYLNTTGFNNTVVGNDAFRNTANSSNNVVIGQSSFARVTGTGASYVDVATDIIAIGPDVTGPATNVFNSIVIGVGASFVSNSVLVVGGINPIQEGYFGSGEFSSSVTNFNLQPSKAQGINQIAGNLSLSSGRSTGNAFGTHISFKTPDILGSGTTLQSLSEKVRITNSGDLVILNNINGLIIKDQSDGNYHKIVTTAGILSTINLGPTIPN